MLATSPLGSLVLAGSEDSTPPDPVVFSPSIGVTVGPNVAAELKPWRAYRGYTLAVEIALFSDAPQRDVLPLTGWQAQVIVGQDNASSSFTLTDGFGLIVAESAGTVQVVLKAYQTASVLVDRLRWFLALTDPAGYPRVPARGLILFEDAL